MLLDILWGWGGPSLLVRPKKFGREGGIKPLSWGGGGGWGSAVHPFFVRILVVEPGTDTKIVSSL